jgi:hypothetical protein
MNDEGLSGREMQRRLRGTMTAKDIEKYPRGVSLHMKISDKEFWKAKRMAASWQENARKAKYGRNDRTFRDDEYGMTPFNMTRGRYQHIVRIKGKNEAGEKAEKHVTVSSSKPLSKAEVYAGVEAIIENDLNAYDFKISSGIVFALVEMYQTT